MPLPHEEAVRFLVSRYARLRAAHGDAIGEPDLVLPTADFFPDALEVTPEGIATLLRRTLSYAPVGDDLPIALQFVEPAAKESAGGGCSSGACGTGGGESAGPIGTALEDENGYRVLVAVNDVRDPVLLTTSLARSTGAIVLCEAGEELDAIEADRLSEIAATACGFGALLTMGACVYTKSCGGLRAHQGTHLTVDEHALALALFVRIHDAKPSAARAHFEVTQREAFDEALRWADANPAVIEALRDRPESLEDGVLPVSESKGIFGKLFGSRAPSPTEPVVVKKRVRSEAEEKRLAETKALVEEALRAR